MKFSARRRASLQNKNEAFYPITKAFCPPKAANNRRFNRGINLAISEGVKKLRRSKKYENFISHRRFGV